jgi:hypothetical protein
LIARYGAIHEFPAHVLGDRVELALLFKKLATLRTDAPLFTDVEALRWRGATDAFAGAAEQDRCTRPDDAHRQTDAHAVADGRGVRNQGSGIGVRRQESGVRGQPRAPTL